MHIECEMLTPRVFGQVSECLVTNFGISCVHQNFMMDRLRMYAALRLVEFVCSDAYNNRNEIACMVAHEAAIDFS